MAEKKVSASEGGKDDSKPVTAKKTSRTTVGKDVAAGEVKSNVLTTATGVKTSDLKDRFAAGSIPLSTDFGNLIDIAECGRRAVGQSPDQTNNTIGAGLSIAAATDPANMGKLSVNLNSSSGLEIKDGAVAVKVGNGIHFDADGAVTFKANTAWGLDADSGGAWVKTGNGIGVDSGGNVTLKLYNSYGLECDSGGTWVKNGNGIGFDSGGNVTVKSKSAGGITVSSDGMRRNSQPIKWAAIKLTRTI